MTNPPSPAHASRLSRHGPNASALLLPLSIGSLSVGSFACKSRGTSESEGASVPVSTGVSRTYSCTPPSAGAGTGGGSRGKVVNSQGTTVAYHWTDENEVLSPAGLKAWMERKFETARTTALESSGNAFGEGLYLASNPTSTAGAGKILVVIPLKPGCVYALAETADWETSKATRDAVEGPHAGVAYSYDADEKAVLVRDASAIALPEAFSIDTRNNEGVALEKIDVKALPGAGWKDALKHYGAVYSFLAPAAVKDTATGAPLLGASGLTDVGFAVALHSELVSGGSVRERALDELIARASTLVDFPLCARREERFPWRGSKYRQCVSALFESVAVHVAPDLSSSMGESPMAVEEAHKVLSALGYSPLLPAITEAQTPFYKGFFENWKSSEGKAAAAEALVRASLLFGKDAGTRRIEDWF